MLKGSIFFKYLIRRFYMFFSRLFCLNGDSKESHIINFLSSEKGEEVLLLLSLTDKIIPIVDLTIDNVVYQYAISGQGFIFIDKKNNVIYEIKPERFVATIGLLFEHKKVQTAWHSCIKSMGDIVLAILREAEGISKKENKKKDKIHLS